MKPIFFFIPRVRRILNRFSSERHLQIAAIALVPISKLETPPNNLIDKYINVYLYVVKFFAQKKWAVIQKSGQRPSIRISRQIVMSIRFVGLILKKDFMKEGKRFDGCPPSGAGDLLGDRLCRSPKIEGRRRWSYSVLAGRPVPRVIRGARLPGSVLYRTPGPSLRWRACFLL